MGSTHSILARKNNQNPSEISYADDDKAFKWLSDAQVKDLLEAVSNI